MTRTLTRAGPATRTSVPIVAVGLASLVLSCSGGAGRPDPARRGMDWTAQAVVDLTHPYNEHTIYWPTAPFHFELDTLAYGETEGGWFYSSFLFRAPEHGGTHLDAPIHFARGGHTVDQVPLESLVGPAVVLDISEKTRDDRDYRLTPDDVLAWEAEHGEIPRGSIVLLRTGWDRFWPDARTYLGTAERGEVAVEQLHFPSYGVEAARLLVEDRGAVALGADVASIDYGQSPDFPVHRLIMRANVPGLENVAHLGRLPPTGATVVALPMKIEGGSGAPVRIVALLPPT